MTEAKFTKGPLEVARDGPSHFGVIDPSRTTTSAGGRVYTASLCTNGDATLYAAAPDMYEALNGLHKTIMNAFPSLAGSEPMVSAIQALSKARGEQ